MLVSLLPLLCGCSEPSPPAALPRPFAGATVKIAVPAGLGLRLAWENALNEWSAQTGATVDLHELNVSDPAKPWDPEIARQHTLLFFPLDRFAELQQVNALAAIPESQLGDEQLHWLDLFQGLRNNVLAWRQQPTVVPFLAPVLVCYYRSDLLKQSGLSPPQTWEDYQQLLETIDAWAPGLTAVEPWHEQFRATMFLARAAAFARHPGHYSFLFDIETGAPLIDSPGFQRAWETARAALTRMPPEVLGYRPADCRRQILSGKAALAIACETGPGNPPLAFAPGDGQPERNPARSQETQPLQRGEGVSVGVCRLPGSEQVYNATRNGWEPLPDKRLNRSALTGFGGLGAGVSAGSDPASAEAAWNLLAQLVSGQGGATFPAGTRGPCRESERGNAAAWTGRELRGAEPAIYFDAVAQSLTDVSVVPELAVIGKWQFRKALTAGLSRGLTGATPPEQVLGEIAGEWAKLVKSIGAAKLRDNYRSSVGLGPLVAPGT